MINKLEFSTLSSTIVSPITFTKTFLNYSFHVYFVHCCPEIMERRLQRKAHERNSNQYVENTLTRVSLGIVTN